MATTANNELLDIRAVASELLGGCSVRHVRRLADSGKMPSPVRLGALIRFRRSELVQWIAGGCKPVRIAGKRGVK
ncbi:MAG: helix-turn-helix domain-containing protein [Planctomycetia bacterium]|nr:helix-turn-helix domain-containing protein [Planctomycetia bacterium]